MLGMINRQGKVIDLFVFLPISPSPHLPHIPITHYPLPTPKLQIPDKLIPRNYEAIAIQTHGMARY